jgi:serine/threonine protein kinase/DNA-binding winged helix-turn-helix (wHTH) protein
MSLNPSPLGIAADSGQVWSFAGREFDESRLKLMVGGQPVELELKPLEILIQLLKHAGEVVPKDQLLNAVWPSVNVVDGSLATAIHKLRKALGDYNSEIVVTVPRVGYRLAAVAHHTTARLPPAPAEMSLQAGHSIPGRERWRLLRRLSTSCNSDVWLGEHPKTSELRVFKFVVHTASLKALKREVMVFRFLRESLGERSDFVRIFEWNFDSPPYFLESEYGGLNLAEWAQSHGGVGNIPMQRRLHLLAKIARSIAAAHAEGVLHRDLKPANILVAPVAGDEEQVKIADFGSASLLEPSRLHALGITTLGLTQNSVPVSPSLTGTLMYMAPEVLSGNSPTPAADVYSLGVMLYQLVIGDFRKPLSAGWERAIEDPLIRDDIAAAACGDPAERITTANELAQRLNDLEDRRSERSRIDKARERERVAERKREQALMRRPWIVLASLGVLVSTSLYFQTRSSAPGPSLKTVAVLPFQNLSSDRSLDFLIQAVPDEIAASLSYARSLSVRSSDTTSKYTQPGLDLQRVGNDVKAVSIVTGHFIRERDALQLTLEAIDVRTGRVFWRDLFTVPASSMIEMREQLVARTQGTLAAALGASAFTSDAGTHPVNEEAYDMYLRAAAIPMDTARNRQAIAMLEKSVGLDSNFASSWLILGRRYYLEGRYANGGRPMMEHFDTSVARALALDPNYVAAGANLTLIRLERGDLANALQESEDLVRRRPDSADAHHILGAVFRYAGLLEESSKECDTAFRLDPHTQTSGLRSCAIVFALRGNYRRAMDYLDLDPTSDFHKAILLTTLLREGHTREALQVGVPNIPQWRTYDMLPAFVQHQSVSESAVMAASVQLSQDPEANYLAAANLAYCGQTGEALRLLKVAVQGNYCSYPAMDFDPFFAGLRTMPQFAEIRTAAIACQQNFLTVRQHLEESQQN